jgi:hypothetical protein
MAWDTSWVLLAAGSPVPMPRNWRTPADTHRPPQKRPIGLRRQPDAGERRDRFLARLAVGGEAVLAV